MKSILFAVVCSVPFACAEDLIVRSGTVHPVTGPDIPNGAVLVRDGRIVEVGLKVAVPKGARTVDAKGLHVYPGMIDSATPIGLTEISSVRETDDTSEIGDFNPQLRAIVAVNPASEHIPVTRANGITTVVSSPDGGIISGQAALIHLDGWTWEEMQVRGSTAMVLQFPTLGFAGGRGGGGGGRFGAASRTSFAEQRRAYEGRLRQVHDFFEQARRYQQAKAAGGPGFETDMKLEAMLPVIEGKLPVVIRAVRERAIRDALKFAETEKIKVVLAGVTDGPKVAAELKAKNVPVILGPTLALPPEEDDAYDRSYTLPAEMHKAGVKFAFGSFGVQFARNLPYQAAIAVAFGLPYQEGLKAVTVNAAEIWGVAGEIGSIEKGKWADLILTDGDPLETRTQIKQCFIKGKPVDLQNKHRRMYEKYMERP